MITTNIETIRNKSIKFEGTEEELNHLFGILEFELTKAPRKGVGLSAIQINIPFRVAIVRTQANKLNLYNAEIIKKEQPFVFDSEGCLSIPAQESKTNRYNLIVVRNGDGKEYSLSGFDAVVVQHELDHWDGVIFLDRSAKG